MPNVNNFTSTLSQLDYLSYEMAVNKFNVNNFHEFFKTVLIDTNLCETQFEYNGLIVKNPNFNVR